VHAFEPIPATFEKLRKRFAGDSRVQPVQLALGAETEIRKFHLFARSEWNSLSNRANWDPGAPAVLGEVEVEVQTLDHYCAAHAITEIDLLKVDAEGCDLEVLRGAGGLLAKRRIQLILCEVYHVNGPDGTSNLTAIDRLLAGHGYRFVALYTDSVVPEADLFGVHNALFALPPVDGEKP
jgi:FkbM family methyltransferase